MTMECVMILIFCITIPVYSKTLTHFQYSFEQILNIEVQIMWKTRKGPEHCLGYINIICQLLLFVIL